uniref:Secreted protein n=1 Tax=Anopheles darlingi TaxID=43151 RepID=A0A2M4DJE6_ANODA
MIVMRVFLHRTVLAAGTAVLLRSIATTVRPAILVSPLTLTTATMLATVMAAMRLVWIGALFHIRSIETWVRIGR